MDNAVVNRIRELKKYLKKQPPKSPQYEKAKEELERLTRKGG